MKLNKYCIYICIHRAYTAKNESNFSPLLSKVTLIFLQYRLIFLMWNVAIYQYTKYTNYSLTLIIVKRKMHKEKITKCFGLHIKFSSNWISVNCIFFLVFWLYMENAIKFLLNRSPNKYVVVLFNYRIKI